MLMLPYLCQIFNQFVNTLGFASFVEYNIFNYLLSTSVALIFIVIIEGDYMHLELKNIHKTFDKHVLFQNLNFNFSYCVSILYPGVVEVGNLHF